MAGEREPLLTVTDLVTQFDTEDGRVTAVDGVSFDVMPGETLGIVGESGSGKSVTALSVIRLIQTPPGRIAGGRVTFKGRDLLGLPDHEMREIRGDEISMIFQEPMTSLNPLFTVGDQIMEAVLLHQDRDRQRARERAVEMLRKVGIPSPEKRVDQYPHQMSGGMRQRVMIAMALACNPSLLIADEPTTALDVTIQAQILDLIGKLKQDTGASVMLITHDLGVIAETADRVIVMYAGQIVETGDVDTIFDRPMHPYTSGLLQSIPRLTEDKDRLHSIEGIVPSPFDMPKGCRFAPRCPLADAQCTSWGAGPGPGRSPSPSPGPGAREAVPLVAIEPGHEVRCVKARKGATA
jgi:peptide/nickel transport system ATP-binding protein/oligopeptide transport system ATP-binding protein